VCVYGLITPQSENVSVVTLAIFFKEGACVMTRYVDHIV
jgi:hypothetical protein